jgi:hypothetical protein
MEHELTQGSGDAILDAVARTSKDRTDTMYRRAEDRRPGSIL